MFPYKNAKFLKLIDFGLAKEINICDYRYQKEDEE